MAESKSFLQKVTSLLKTAEVAEQNTSVMSHRSISDDEIEYLQDRLKTPKKDNWSREGNAVDKIVEPIFEKLSAKVISNDKLEAIAPEIGQSGQIFISSLISPNDLKTNRFNVDIVNSVEEPGVLKDISNLLISYFGDELQFREKLSKWLYDALYRHGAKAVMVVPSATIKDGAIIKGALEGMETKQLLLDNSLHDNFSRQEGALEDLDLDTVKKVGSSKDKIVKAIEGKGMFSMTSDVREIKTHADAVVTISSQIGSAESFAAGTDGLVSIQMPEVKDSNKEKLSISIPGIIELPYESVVPLCIDGAPKTPVGYIVMINEHGTPIKAKKQERSIDRGNPSEGQRVADLYTAFFGNTRMSSDDGGLKSKSQIIEKVLATYFNAIVKTAVDAKGISSITPELSSAVVTTLFFRTLRQMKTKFVFVPTDMLMYMAFDYNDDGTGKSMIDDIIMPLAFKNTLVVSRLLALIESSTPHKKITVDIDDTAGNVHEILRTIKAEAKKNRTVGISADPTTVIQNHCDREITVVPKRIPGVESFEIESETSQIQYPQPDDSLIESIDNMIAMKLGVTASSLNRLKDEDFAASVASSNLFMSNSIILKQSDCCKAVSKLMRMIIRFDSNLQGQIMDIIKNAKSEPLPKKDQTKPEDGVASPENTNEKRFVEIVNNVIFTLPKPNIVSDKSQFNEIREFTSIIRDLVDAVFDEDMVRDNEAQDVLKVVKGVIRSKLISEYMADQNVFSGILEAKQDLPLSSIAKFALSMTNMEKLINDIKEKTSDGESDSGGSNW